MTATVQATAQPQINSVGDFFGTLVGGGFNFLGNLAEIELQEERYENQLKIAQLNAQMEAATRQESIDASRRNTAVEAARGAIGTDTLIMIGGGAAALIALLLLLQRRR